MVRRCSIRINGFAIRHLNKAFQILANCMSAKSHVKGSNTHSAPIWRSLVVSVAGVPVVTNPASTFVTLKSSRWVNVSFRHDMKCLSSWGSPLVGGAVVRRPARASCKP